MSPRPSDDQDDAAADEHGNAGTVDDAGEDVASEFVGSEPVRVRWRTEAIGKMDSGRILWRDPGREYRAQDEEDYQHDSDRCQRIMAGIAADTASDRDGRRRHCALS